LASVYFFLFPKLKSQLKGKCFQDISTIQTNVTEQIRSTPKDSFKKSFQSLYERYELFFTDIARELFRRTVYI
jgi:hypothetical protein